MRDAAAHTRSPVGHTRSTPAALVARIVDQVAEAPPPGIDAQTLRRWHVRNKALLTRMLQDALARRGRAGSLHELYGPIGAPQPGERGYVPPVNPARGLDQAAHILGEAIRLLPDPEVAAAWQTDPAEAEDEGWIWTRADIPDLYGLPYEDAAGRSLDVEGRIELAEEVLELAFAVTDFASGDRFTSAAQIGAEIDWRLPQGIAEGILAERLIPPDDGLRLVNVPRDTAAVFIRLHHSHLPQLNPRGLQYAIGVRKGRRLVAVATAGAPTGRWSKRIDPHRVLELTRVASDGTVKGAASKLVGRMIDLLPRSGRGGQPGELFVTYSLVGEPGTPYRALADKGLRPVAVIGGKRPGGRRTAEGGLKGVAKIRWEAGPQAIERDWGMAGLV